MSLLLTERYGSYLKTAEITYFDRKKWPACLGIGQNVFFVADFDVAKAFDTVWIAGLFFEIRNGY